MQEGPIMCVPKDVLKLMIHMLADSRPRSRWGVLATWRCVCRLFHSTVSVDRLREAMLSDLREFPQVKDTKDSGKGTGHRLNMYCAVHPRKIKTMDSCLILPGPFIAASSCCIMLYPARQLLIRKWPAIFERLCVFLKGNGNNGDTLLWYAVSNSYHIYLQWAQNVSNKALRETRPCISVRQYTATSGLTTLLVLEPNLASFTRILE